MPANQDLSSIDMNLAEIEKKASILKNSFKKHYMLKSLTLTMSLWIVHLL